MEPKTGEIWRLTNDIDEIEHFLMIEKQPQFYKNPKVQRWTALTLETGTTDTVVWTPTKTWIKLA